jgi:hypothetical protein
MKLSKKEFLDILKEKKACLEAAKWVNEHQAETFAEIWNECDRADWMLWIMDKKIKEKEWPSKQTVVLCACDCAETAMKFVPEDEHRPKIAIQTARKWAEGKVSERECGKAAADAYASYAYSAASSASVYAAYHAAAASYAVASYAAYAASYAAYAAYASYSFYASDAAYVASSAFYSASFSAKEALKNMADIIRKRVSF